MKKKILIVFVALFLVILLFPSRKQLKDGGTVEYQALVYKVSKVKRLIPEDVAEKEGKVKNYYSGIIIEIFGVEIYNNVE